MALFHESRKQTAELLEVNQKLTRLREDSEILHTKLKHARYGIEFYYILLYFTLINACIYIVHS